MAQSKYATSHPSRPEQPLLITAYENQPMNQPDSQWPEKRRQSLRDLHLMIVENRYTLSKSAVYSELATFQNVIFKCSNKNVHFQTLKNPAFLSKWKEATITD